MFPQGTRLVAYGGPPEYWWAGNRHPLMVTVKSSTWCSVVASLLAFSCARMDLTESESGDC